MRSWCLVLAACGSSTQAAPERGAPGMLELVKDPLCATRGVSPLGGAVTESTTRAVALGTSGDAAALTFRYRGQTRELKKLASGQERRQLGLKLRAANGCNLVYVMWRTDEGKAPMVDVSVKLNPGDVTHADCGPDGYTRLKPSRDHKLALVPVLAAGDQHTLRAAISGDTLRAWIDDKLVWQGTLPDGARGLVGPAGIRSDNLSYDLVSFAAPAGDAAAKSNCTPSDGD